MQTNEQLHREGDGAIGSDETVAPSRTDPPWSNEAPPGLATKVRRRLASDYRQYVRFRGNPVAHLRFLGVRIGHGVSILNSIGNYGSEPWLIEIGDRVTVTKGVVFHTHDGSSRIFRERLPEGNPRYGNQFGPVRILDDSFVGTNAIILPGVTVGPKSVVGAGSVVTKDVPPGTVAAGNPATVLMTLEEYLDRYRDRMIPVEAEDFESLRRELTRRFFNEER